MHQHLPNSPARDAKLPRYRPPALTIHQNSPTRPYSFTSNIPYEFTSLPFKATNPRDESPAVDSFYTATTGRSRGPLWPVFALALICGAMAPWP
jgi:hypothetical protein